MDAALGAGQPPIVPFLVYAMDYGALPSNGYPAVFQAVNPPVMQ